MILQRVLCCILLFVFLACNTTTKKQNSLNYSSQLIWTGGSPNFINGDISKDGRYFSDINWNTGDLKIVDLETGESHPLTGQGYESDGYAWMSLFSQDGKHVVYAWYNFEIGTHELRLYTFETKKIKTLIPATTDIYFIEPLDWSQDNQIILLGIYPNKKNADWQLATISPNDGKVDIIFALDWQSPGGMHPYAYPSAFLSPDSRFIGFDYVANEINNSRDLYTVSLETREKKVLLESKGIDRFLSWNKDGSEVLFYSDRNGLPSLWKLPVKNGFANGEPQLVKNNIPGIHPIGYSNKGYAYGLRVGNRNTYLASINAENGEVLESPKQVDDSINSHRNVVGDWSKDGRELLYITYSYLPNTREFATIKTVVGTNQREIAFPSSFHNKAGTTAWINENTILIAGISRNSKGVHLFDLQSGEIKKPTDFGDKGFFTRFKANSDGSLIYVEMRGKNSKVVSMDTKTGEHKTILEGLIIKSSLSLSPNDQQIAYLKNYDSEELVSLEVLDLITGDISTIKKERRGILSNPVEWTSNGKRILVGINLSENKRGLWSLEVAKQSDPVFINLPGVVGNTLKMSPDGSRIAFQSGTDKGSIYFLKSF